MTTRIGVSEFENSPRNQAEDHFRGIERIASEIKPPKYIYKAENLSSDGLLFLKAKLKAVGFNKIRAEHGVDCDFVLYIDDNPFARKGFEEADFWIGLINYEAGLTLDLEDYVTIYIHRYIPGPSRPAIRKAFLEGSDRWSMINFDPKITSKHLSVLLTK